MFMLAPFLDHSLTLNEEAICSSEISVGFCRITLRNVTEDGSVRNHRCANLKSYNIKQCSEEYPIILYLRNLLKWVHLTPFHFPRLCAISVDVHPSPFIYRHSHYKFWPNWPSSGYNCVINRAAILLFYCDCPGFLFMSVTCCSHAHIRFV
jgi:hypothetical protein